MADNRSIGVFDSGLGGLSVVRELESVLPDENIVYFGDTGRVPYGTKSKETIIKYAREDEAFLLSRDVKMIIAACGTVSSVASGTALELPVPFVEVVTPTCVEAAAATRSGRIGIIGTPATVASKSYENLLLKLMPGAVITAAACPMFVPLVENGWIERDDVVVVETAKRYLEPLIAADVDVLILGCTHFPVLSGVIGDIMGGDVTLINAGKCAADAAARYLKEHDMLTSGCGSRAQSYFVSDRSESFSKTASILLGRDISDDVSFADASEYGVK